MKLLYIGGGFVGACSAAVAANSGHKVLVFDVDKYKIQQLGSGDRDQIESCLFEKGLGDLLVRNASNISFSFDYADVQKFVDDCDAIFMCLPTPEVGETGESNLSYYFSAAEELAQVLLKRKNETQENYVVIVNKSTVPVDMVYRTKEIMENHGVKNFGVVSNPEFLVEGKAVEGSLKPDRIVIGAENQKDFEMMRQIYQRFVDSEETKYIEVGPKEAASGKLLANFCLFIRLATCFDVVGRTCEAFGVNFESVRKILSSDKRIGTWGFYDSLYAGGSCLIKDARSLSHQLQTSGYGAELVNEVYNANRRQLELFLSRPESELNFDWKDKKVAVLGLSFKRDTNDIRNTPSVNIVNFLLDHQVGEIYLHDRAGSENFKKVFPERDHIKYFDHEFEAVKDSDVIIIATDWPQFRGLADSIIGELKKKPLIVDGRRILQHRYKDLQEAGFDIVAVGSPFIKGKK